jgi:hypothetical protein
MTSEEKVMASTPFLRFWRLVREWERLARRREQARLRSKREENRVTYVNGVIDLHRETDRLRSWLLAVEPKLATETSNDFRRMIS